MTDKCVHPLTHQEHYVNLTYDPEYYYEELYCKDCGQRIIWRGGEYSFIAKDGDWVL